MADDRVRILFKRTIRPTTTETKGDDHHIIHLTPWDIRMISVDYIQKGMLFPKPHPQDHETMDDHIISILLSSFTRALDLFFPLAGRLATTQHATSPPSLSIFIDCADQGAEFIHASASHVTVSDILTPLYIPTIINSFFPLNGAVGHDGHTLPLLAVQVTDLVDGIFIACSLNHTVADGTSFWDFINTWSLIARSNQFPAQTPLLGRSWLLDYCPLPISLPFTSHHDFIRRPLYAPVSECFFHFPAHSIAKLKAKANAEMNTNKISSLQALLAHAWRSAIRARALEPDEDCVYMLLVGCRSRLNPPLPQAYLGNSVVGVAARATAAEVVERGLGRAAWLLNQAIAAQSVEGVHDWLETWIKEPSFTYLDHLKRSDLGTGSSPRFNMYGNDFGWGRPVAVRSGPGNKLDGKVTVYPGIEKGSMGLEVCLSAQALAALVEDAEFMEATGKQ